MSTSSKKISALISQALSFYENGHFNEAKIIYFQVLDIEPNDFSATQMLGILFSQTKNYSLAIEYLSKAIQLNPNYAPCYNNLGIVFHELNQLDNALINYTEAVKIEPSYAEAHFNQGNALIDLDRLEESLTSYNSAIRFRPDYAEAHFNQGIVLQELKQFDAAITSYNSAVRFRPDYAEAHFNQGIVLQELKQFDAAITSYNNAIRFRPDYAEAHFNQAIVLQELNQFDGAIASYKNAIRYRPDYAEAYLNLGNVFQSLKQFDAAIASCNSAIHLRPDYAEAHLNLGNVFQDLGEIDAATKSYKICIDLNPNYAEAHHNLGLAFREIRQFNLAIKSFINAKEINSNLPWLEGNLLFSKMQIGDFSDFKKDIGQIYKQISDNKKSVEPFVFLSMSDDPLLQKKVSEIWVKDKCHSANIFLPIGISSKKEKIRLAYISPDFRTSPVGLLTAELFELHDRSKFEVIGFSLKNSSCDDELVSRLKKGFDKFIDVHKISDLEISEMVRKMGVDIAIDLAGHTGNSRHNIFSCRPAPIQVNFLGYPGTSGTDFIDYIIADNFVIPPSKQQFYTEKVAYLPNTLMVDDSKRVPSVRVFTREECGLPRNNFIFCCFNNAYKINEMVLDSWARILQKSKNSVLWIAGNGDQFKSNILIEFKNRGIDFKRIIFSEKLEKMEDHLSRFSLADLFLDTNPYSALTTTLDSLKAGVPVLTLAGQSFVSRIPGGILNAIKLSELITESFDHYESLAIELASNPIKMNAIKNKLKTNLISSPLFDTALFTKNLESAYIKMLERYHSNLDPDHLIIS